MNPDKMQRHSVRPFLAACRVTPAERRSIAEKAEAAGLKPHTETKSIAAMPIHNLKLL
ncbi:hypothetical protein LCGC14_1185690, partial [marine sediment metagenome]